MIIKSSIDICVLYIASTLVLEHENVPINIDQVICINSGIQNFNLVSQIQTSYNIIFKMTDGTNIIWCYSTQEDADSDINSMSILIKPPIYHTFIGGHNDYQNDLLKNSIIHQVFLSGELQYPEDYTFDSSTGTITPISGYVNDQRLAIFF